MEENKEILPEDIWNDEKRENIKKAIKAHEWMPFERYLIWLGERSVDYSYTTDVIFEHLDYFRRGWLNHTNPYYLLEMFSFELDDKIEEE